MSAKKSVMKRAATKTSLARNKRKHSIAHVDDSGIPTGAIFPYYGLENTAHPPSFYFCNGDIITKVTDALLYAVLVDANPALKINNDQCHLPDLRGQFLRGFDDGRGIDRGRAFGSEQQDELASHSHNILRTTKGPSGPSIFVNWSYMGPVHNKGQTPGISATGGIETRPVNVALNFIIKR